MAGTHADILIIGGGVAGLSAAAALAGRASVVVLEAEETVGFHSSGRSAAMLHYALGNPLVRALTRASRGFFEQAPAEPGDAPLATPLPLLVHARTAELEEIDRLERELSHFAPHERLDAAGLRDACPLLRTGPGHAEHGLIDRTALKLDGHAMLQAYLRILRARSGEVRTSARVARIARSGATWEVETESGERHSAAVVVNAAGAWADAVASLAAVTAIGIAPMRRTIIVFDAPAGADLSRVPFTKTVGDELYFGVEGGRLFASPMDEVPTDPCDAQPDEYEVALAAHRVEERTLATVGRIAHRWAGLRSFAPDRSPVAGFAPDADGFFWLAGQGGAGLQTAPAMAAIAASLILGEPWPAAELSAAALSPGRFSGQPA